MNLARISTALAAALVMSCVSTEPPPLNSGMKDAAAQSAVEGTATYRERIALPPGAIFEAVLQDVTLADVKSTEVARTTVMRFSGPPIRFSIAFDPTKIDPAKNYSIRAGIRVDGKLWFTSDTAHPVLTRGAGSSVDILLERVDADLSAATGRASLMGGEMVYMADAARFTDCATGSSYPIAMEGDFIRMQQDYGRSASKPGTWVYVTFEGSIAERPRMEGSGVERNVVVSRFVRAWPNQNCERSRADVSLMNTYWRIVSLGGEPVGATGDKREPHLLLKSVHGKQAYAATVGCNQMSGGLTLTGEIIGFSPGVATLMACPPPLDAREKSLITALTTTKRWQIKGNTLELLDALDGQTALCEAVHL